MFTPGQGKTSPATNTNPNPAEVLCKEITEGEANAIEPDQDGGSQSKAPRVDQGRLGGPSVSDPAPRRQATYAESHSASSAPLEQHRL
ncbi:hypothetical protein NL676_008561 [Syzygium grande]|nr:hypothetical protein NL676_008561 [Syzygium grande]